MELILHIIHQIASMGTEAETLHIPKGLKQPAPSQRTFLSSRDLILQIPVNFVFSSLLRIYVSGSKNKELFPLCDVHIRWTAKEDSLCLAHDVTDLLVHQQDLLPEHTRKLCSCVPCSWLTAVTET